VRTLVGLGRHLGAASLAGIVAGVLVSGVLGRLAMRVAGFTSRPELIGVQTSNGNRVGEITASGTLALALFVGIAAGIGGGILYASAEPWLRSRPGKGALFGVALFAALGFTVLDPNNVDFRRFGYAPLNIVMFAGLFVAFGATVAWLFDRIRGVIAGTGPIAAAGAGVAGLVGLGAAALAAFSFLSVGGSGDLAVAALFAAAVLIPPIVRWRGLPRPIGYAAFGLPLLAGAVRTVGGLAELLG